MPAHSLLPAKRAGLKVERMLAAIPLGCAALGFNTSWEDSFSVMNLNLSELHVGSVVTPFAGRSCCVVPYEQYNSCQDVCAQALAMWMARCYRTPWAPDPYNPDRHPCTFPGWRPSLLGSLFFLNCAPSL